MTDPDLDVVVIGGGIQGLLALDALIERRYACALVTDGTLGGGQTLHSHGFLNTGFGFMGPELPAAVADVVHPYLRSRGVPVNGEWMLIPPPGMPPPDGAADTVLPDGFDTARFERSYRVADRNLPKRRLVEVLSQGRLERVVRGRASLQRTGSGITVTVHRDHGEIVLAPRAVVVAAGCGSKRLLGEIASETDGVREIKHRRVHMIVMRAPRGALPAVSVMAMPLGLMLVAHESDDAVTWYVTPMEFGGPSFDDVPSDAKADVDPATIARGCEAVLALYPRLADVRELVVGCYAGYRQDIGDQPGLRRCELVEGASNVIVALPSGLVAPWLNAARVAELVATTVEPRGRQSPIPGGGENVEVGTPVEDRPGFVWTGLNDALRAL